ncbi:hypothetical protein STCU_06748 [Strigomonas culicis]|uniref:Rab-GAP TBC domain-containing protein n=1 Tax=Strigomonas culicis TaxID=28005 RepID=S9VQJ2_9TRYP|nr:hypothetical protein STCU_06748 [Strigomonas culicis]|eukprot:EPY25495.1 hypothetical protein STCU_06748 [Strigomonas culicis]
MAEYVGDSDKYFVYEDDVKVLLEALVTDKSLPDGQFKSTLAQLGRPTECFDSYIVYLFSRKGDLILQTAPPCGFLPVAAFALLVAPVCYTTGDTVEQYALASALTGQLWFRLQGPTPELLQGALLFERLVARLAPGAARHMRHTLQLSPLRLALEWITTGFAELLDPVEVLVLWDLLLAYHVREVQERSPLSALTGLLALDPDTPLEGLPKAPCALWLMAIFAAAIFVFRAPMVERCTGRRDVLSLFSVGHQLKVRPLLQYILFEATAA